MIEGMDAVTTQLLGLAMDAATLRQQAIAANIANVNSIDHQPLRVDFETQLEDARAQLQTQGRISMGALAGVEPRLEATPSLRSSGLPAKVLLDMEVANMARNAIQYQALARGLSRHFAILSAAVSDGKK